MKRVDSVVGGAMKWMGVVFLVLVLAAASAFSSPTCMQFLRISTLPRVSAIGEAAAAVRDATWAEANPSHLTSIVR